MSFVRKVKTNSGTYLAKVKNVRKNGKVIQKHLGMIGKMENGEKILYGKIHDAKVTDVSIAGDVMILNAIANELGLLKLLDNYTDKGKWILAMVLAQCTQPTPVYKMNKWCKKYGAPDLLNLPHNQTKKGRFFNALDALNEIVIPKIEKKLFKRIKKMAEKNKRSIFYDVTATYFFGTQCSIAIRGYNSKKFTTPQIKIGLAVTKKFGFPIFHQVFHGNIQDSQSIDQVIRSLKDYKVRGTTLVWDRGISSERALSKAKKANLWVLAGIPLKGEKLKTKAKNMRKNIDTFDNRIKLSTETFYAKDYKSKIYGHEGTGVICSNEKTKLGVKETRYDKIENAIQIYKKEKKKSKIEKSIRELLTFEKNNVKVNKKKLKEEEKLDGISILFSTNPKLSKNEIVKMYFQRDKIEKVFQCLKSLLKLRPINHYRVNRVKAHVFICYLAYALISVIDYKLQKANLDITWKSALELIEDIHKVKLYDPKTKNVFVKQSVMSKDQEDIFKSIDENLLEM